MRPFFYSILLFPFIATCATACAAADSGVASMTFEISSPAFTNGQPIPRKYTCDAENVSPPLAWSGIPAGTQSLVLIADDPDAPRGTWVHWVLFNMPPTRAGLDEGASRRVSAEGAGLHGTNDFRQQGYGGPCPPSGTHRYFFRLYALDTTLNLPAGATRAQVDKAMAGHILAKGEVMGTYKR